MSFRIIGDEIEYEFRPFARIIAPEFSIARYDAIEDLELCDRVSVERENEEWRKDFEAEQIAEITQLQERISDLEKEKEALEKLLDSIDGGATAAELITEAQDETAKWRAIAMDNRNAYLEAIKPKPRIRKNRKS